MRRRTLMTVLAGAALYPLSAGAQQKAMPVIGIEAICDSHKVPLPAAALQFPFGHPSVAAVIPGALLPEQVGRNVAATGPKLDTPPRPSVSPLKAAQ